MKAIYAVAIAMLFLCGTLIGQQRTDWVNASNSPEIQYRSQILDQTKACYLEFRDQHQSEGYTSFDVAVDYKSTDLNSDHEAVVKTDSEHIVTASTHTGSSRISNCTGVLEARVNFVRRH
jgi:hypothetical protein